MKKALALLFFSVLSFSIRAQELFPLAEPASNVPKGAIGVRAFDEGYKEADLLRNVAALRIMYGVTSKLSVYATGTVSNYHEKTLPYDFITHNHTSTSVSGGSSTPQQGVPYPYVFNSIDVYAKYRIVTSDGQNTHFRLAVYGEGSYVAVPSHEAEPDLLVHTTGYGGGVIATYLTHHFAASLTTGFIIPSEYKGDASDKFGGVYPTTIQYGNAVNYDLSLGYLLFPHNYKSYKQTNWNVYCEFIGKEYGAAHVTQLDGPPSAVIPDPLVIKVANTTPILKAGNYLNIAPGLQCIINSTYRIDMSVELPVINRSYNYLYPLYLVGVQRYFFPFVKHTTEKID